MLDTHLFELRRASAPDPELFIQHRDTRVQCMVPGRLDDTRGRNGISIAMVDRSRTRAKVGMGEAVYLPNGTIRELVFAF